MNDAFVSLHLNVSIELLLESRLEFRSMFLTRMNVERGGVKNVRLLNELSDFKVPFIPLLIILDAMPFDFKVE